MTPYISYNDTLSNDRNSEHCALFTICDAKTLENSLFIEYGKAVCALTPYWVWNLKLEYTGKNSHVLVLKVNQKKIWNQTVEVVNTCTDTS